MTAVDTSPAAAQTVQGDLQTAFATVSGHLLKAATMVPAARYAERPAEGIRTFLQLVAHVADGNDYFCRLALGEQVEWADTKERAVRTRDEAIAMLQQSITACEAAYARAGARSGPLVDNIAHANLHYGNAIVYLRAMGMTPPSN